MLLLSSPLTSIGDGDVIVGKEKKSHMLQLFPGLLCIEVSVGVSGQDVGLNTFKEHLVDELRFANVALVLTAY